LRGLAEALQNQEIARETLQRRRVAWARRDLHHMWETRSLSQPAEMLYISAVILAEIRLDIERVAEPGRRTSEGNMLQWRLPIGEGRKTGRDFSQPDLMIGATALGYGPAVVSNVSSIYEKASVLAATARPAAVAL
jgi:predicted nucleic acid-binding protein